MSVSRRRFLARTGWIAGGLTVVGAGGCSLVPPLPTFGGSDVADIVTWVQLQPNGRVCFLLPRAELGQGIGTGLSQVVAEELAAPIDIVDCHHQNTDAMAPCQMTVGSQSIENYLTLTARAAACLRETLRQRAALRLEVSAGTLEPRGDGGFVHADGRGLGYGELLQPDEAAVIPLLVDQNPELLSARPEAELQVVGRRQRSPSALAIVTGRETYSRDKRVDNLHFGEIARPPQIGARFRGYDRQAAQRVAGVTAVVERDGQVGVVARTPMAARAGVEALAVDWIPLQQPALDAIQQTLDVDGFAARAALDHAGERTGDVEAAGRTATQRLSLRYDSPMAAHAAMEPRAAVARWVTDANGAERCEIWTGSQDPWLVRASAAKAVGLPADRVCVHNHRVGGAFGGRVLCQAAVEAAWLTKAAGVPVKVQWTREDEFCHNYVGPAFSTRIEAGLDADGRITHWHHRAVGAPILTSSTFIPGYLHWLANRVPDPGTKRGMELPYAVANRRLEFADERLPMSTGPWRGLGAAPNTFAVECAMDELAVAAGIEPIEFRLRHLDAPRLGHCLRRLRVKLAGESGEFGIAATAYKGVTFVALAAKVERIRGRIAVTRLVCVHDCGRVIAPDQVRAQVEGNLVWGVGMALRESFALAGGSAATRNFDRYQLPRNADVPDMDIELVRSSAPPSGAAEAALAPAAAAIANAVYAASGERHRALPLSDA
ncbi:MAG: molybdopterin cofactor-binding domain-containing protein [Pseudomonadota bacterium]